MMRNRFTVHNVFHNVPSVAGPYTATEARAIVWSHAICCPGGYVQEQPAPEFMMRRRIGRGDDHDNRIDEQREGGK